MNIIPYDFKNKKQGKVNNTQLFVESPSDLSLALEDQLYQILNQVDKRFLNQGLTKQDIISVNIFLSEFEDLNKVIEIWNTWIGDLLPSEYSFLKTNMGNRNCLIEIGFLSSLSDQSMNLNDFKRNDIL